MRTKNEGYDPNRPEPKHQVRPISSASVAGPRIGLFTLSRWRYGFKSRWDYFQRLIRTRAREEGREDLGELRPAHLPVFHVDGLEHRLVEPTAHRRSSLHVRRVAVACELDRRSEDVLPTVEVRHRDVELLLRRPLLRGDAILLVLQQLKRDGVRVEDVEELMPLVRELGELLGKRSLALRGHSPPLGDLRFKLLVEPAHPSRRKLHSLVHVLHEGFGVAGQDVWLLTSGARLSSLPEAIEVQVRAFGQRER